MIVARILDGLAGGFIAVCLAAAIAEYPAQAVIALVAGVLLIVLSNYIRRIGTHV